MKVFKALFISIQLSEMHGTESVNDLNEVAVISCIIFSKETLSAVLQHSLHATVQYLRDTTRRQKAYFSTIAQTSGGIIFADEFHHLYLTGS